jgi:hypothetical protein
MIAKFFNKTRPINTLIIVVVLTFIYILSFFYLNEDISGVLFFSKNALFFLVLLVTFFIINFIVRKNGLTKDNSYVLLILGLCFGMFPFATLNKHLLITHLLLLLAYRRIYSLRTNKDTKEKLFDSAFWIGIATIVYPNSFLYLLLIYTAIFTFNKSTIRNILIPLVGFLTPILIYGAYLFAVDDFNSFNLQLNYSFSFLNYNSLELLIPITLILGYLLWAIFPTTIRIVTVNNEFRTSWFLLLIHLLISILLIIPSLNKDGSEFLFLFFPAAIILTNYLQIVKEKWFKEVFLYLFLVITVAIYFL